MAAALNSLYKWAVPAAIGISAIQASIYDVKGGTRAVIFDRLSGVKEEVKNEGTHFLIPWIQRSIIYDVRTKPRNISTTTGSKDLQMVSLTLRVLHRPEVKMLPKIYQVWHGIVGLGKIFMETNMCIRTLVKITTSESFHLSVMRSSNPLSLSSTPQNSSPNVKLSAIVSVKTSSNVPKNSTSNSRTFPSPT